MQIVAGINLRKERVHQPQLRQEGEAFSADGTTAKIGDVCDFLCSQYSATKPQVEEGTIPAPNSSCVEPHGGSEQNGKDLKSALGNGDRFQFDPTFAPKVDHHNTACLS